MFQHVFQSFYVMLFLMLYFTGVVLYVWIVRAVQQFNSNTTGVTSETGTANPSRAHELTLVLSRVRDAQSSSINGS
jgi:hypothetical protein